MGAVIDRWKFYWLKRGFHQMQQQVNRKHG